jgi:hypothetical protein
MQIRMFLLEFCLIAAALAFINSVLLGYPQSWFATVVILLLAFIASAHWLRKAPSQKSAP